MADLANDNQSKKWVADVSQKVCTRLAFVLPCPQECNFLSEMKIESDLRLKSKNIGQHLKNHVLLIIESDEVSKNATSLSETSLTSSSS